MGKDMWSVITKYHHELDKSNPRWKRDEGCQSLQGKGKGDEKNAYPREVDVEGYEKCEWLGGCQ
jgi:hypothetical protein